MPELMTLAVPRGAESYPISYGDRSFAPYRENHTDPMSRWLVDVPPVAAIGFCHTGGFTMVEAATAVPAGFALVRHPTDPAAMLSNAQPDGRGNLIVAAGSVVAAIAHGFVALAEGEDLAPPVQLTPAEQEKRMAEMAAQIIDLEQRLHLAGDVAEKLATENAELHKALEEATKPAEGEPKADGADPAKAPVKPATEKKA